MMAERSGSLRAATLPSSFTQCGFVKKHSRYRKKLRINQDFKYFLDSYRVDYSTYGYALGNLDTSFNAITKYVGRHVEFDDYAFNIAESMLRESYGVVEKSRLSYDVYEWMDMTTSPGYPWSLVHKDKKSAAKDPDVRQTIFDIVDSERPPQGIWTNACKVEPKKWEKIDANNSRVITGAPIEIQALGTYLFAEMNENIYKAGRTFQIPSTVGWTHYYLGMHDLYRRVSRFPVGAAWDYKEFDGRVHPREMYMVRDLRFGLLNARHQTPRVYSQFCDYYDEMINCRIVMETGDVIQKHFGQPSGQVNTLPDNSMINEFRWYYIWVLYTPPELHNLKSFRQHVELIVCGDDSLITCSPLGQEVLSYDHVKEVGEKTGWLFKVESDYAPTHTLSYCSKNFFYYYGYVLPVPSNVDKLVASLLYGDKGKEQFARERLARVLGIRLEAFWLPKFRSVLDEYIHFTFTEYDLQLRQAPTQDMPSFDDLLALRKDWASVLRLFINTAELDERSWHPRLRGPVQSFSNEHIFDLEYGSAGF